jgi:hypothetical protein
MSLAILAAVVACVSWTVTQEEVFREPREHCKRLSMSCRLASLRKFFYLFTCEYCFSHYVAALVILISGYRLHSAGGFGAVVAWLSLVWTANIYMSLFRLLRLGIKLVGNKAKIAEYHAEMAHHMLPQHLKGETK